MKILITSDWHLDAVTAGVSRSADIAEAVDWTVQLATDRMVNLYVFLGDLCDPDANRAPACVAKAINTAQALMARGIGSRWLVGNHDVIEDGSGTSTMEPIEAAGHALRKKPMHELFTFTIGKTMLVWLPFVPKVAAYDPVEFIRSCPTDVDRVFVFGHLNVPGVVPASETHEMPRGREVWMPTDAIREHWHGKAVIFNGHYHATTDGKKAGVGIPGTLQRLTFGEQDNVVGCFIVDLEAGTAEHVVYPKARELMTIGPDHALWTAKKLTKLKLAKETIVRLQPPTDCPASRIDELRDFLREKVAAVKVMPAPKSAAVITKTESVAKAPRVSTRGVIEQLMETSMTADRDMVRVIVEQAMSEAGL